MSSDNEIGLIIWPTNQEAHQVLETEVYIETFNHDTYFILFFYNKISIRNRKKLEVQLHLFSSLALGGAEWLT